MSTSGDPGASGINLGSGATGNLMGDSGAASGFSMPNGSGNTLFSMPNGGAAMPGQGQMNPFSMGQGTMNGPMLSGQSGMPPAMNGLLSAAGGKPQSGQQDLARAMGGGAGMHGAGAGGFMPGSAITLPYSLATGGVQSLLQQILQRANSNPTQG